jgi:hypothetical protein
VLPDRKRQLDDAKAHALPEPPLALAVQDGGTPGGLFPSVQDVPIHVRGSYARLGPVVPRHLPGFFAGDHQPPIRKGSGRRELARWVASADNPLFARVLVNRVWQHHFGEGLVRTPSNFGLLGDRPSHPELLDWLAREFVRGGWSLKRLHRLIVLSATYQQAATATPEQQRLDPGNVWLGRMVPRRLEAEALRDAILAVNGRLQRVPGGPATSDLDSPRRSLYVQTTRWDRGNYSTLFDAANPDQSIDGRTVSTVAPQALFLLNHPFPRRQAEALARRLLRVAADERERVELAYRLLYARRPTSAEMDVALSCVHSATTHGTLEQWTDLAHVLLCSNEFAYVD